MVHTRKVGVGVSYEEMIDYMCMDKGCVSYVVINKYYYQYICLLYTSDAADE